MSRGSSPRRGAAPIALAALGLVVLAFILGAWTAHRDVFPYRGPLRRAFLGAEALSRTVLPRGEDTGDVWVDAPGAAAGRGLWTNEPGLPSPGETLITVGQSAHLLGLDGEVLHTWHLDYGAIRPAGGRTPDPSRIFWRPARAFPNGELLAIVDEFESPEGGLALIRLDRDSRLLWAYHGAVHHDFDVADDGRVFVLGKRVIPEPPRNLTSLRGPLLDELVLELSPGGELLGEVSIVEAFSRSPYRAIPNRRWEDARSPIGDYLHSNNLDLVTAADEARFPFAREGQALISLRAISTIAILNLKKTRITWARADGWSRQHDPDFLDNGRILLFDNQGDVDRGGRSRVIEYDPATRGIAWEFPGAISTADLQTRYRGDQQRLENGNTLITEFHAGRVLEVTPEGKIAWEYLSPFTNPANPGQWGRIFYAERYPPGFLRFDRNGGLSGRPAQGGHA